MDKGKKVTRQQGNQEVAEARCVVCQEVYPLSELQPVKDDGEGVYLCFGCAEDLARVDEAEAEDG